MQVLIETYRGWEISFDSDKENFYVMSEYYDTDKTKLTFNESKKFIDEYIKANQNFKPFVIEVKPSQYSFYPTRKVVGIRKDGVFMVEDENGKRTQLSKYNEINYFLRNPDNDAIYAKIAPLKKQIKTLSTEIKELEKTITGVSLEDHRKTLI